MPIIWTLVCPLNNRSIQPSTPTTITPKQTKQSEKSQPNTYFIFSLFAGAGLHSNSSSSILEKIRETSNKERNSSKVKSKVKCKVKSKMKVKIKIQLFFYLKNSFHFNCQLIINSLSFLCKIQLFFSSAFCVFF